VARWSTVGDEAEIGSTLVLADGNGVELLRFVAEIAA
jgi:hypothetical protein